MLDRLERAGYLRRVPSPHDRRVVLIERTEKDRAFQAQYVQVSQEMAALFYAGFSEAEIEDRKTPSLALIEETSYTSDSACITAPCF